MKKIFASVVMALLAVGLMSTKAWAWRPDQFKAVCFNDDPTAYTLVYNEEAGTANLLGPVPSQSGSGILDLWRRSVWFDNNDPIATTWERVPTHDYECNFKDGEFSCEIEINDSDLGVPVEIAVAGHNNVRDITDSCHTPGLLLSEYVTAEEALLTLGCLLDSDCDDDGVLNSEDNCKVHDNADQVDSDGDGRGDTCDSDMDHDGVIDDLDICPDYYNPAQVDNCPASPGDFERAPAGTVEFERADVGSHTFKPADPDPDDPDAEDVGVEDEDVDVSDVDGDGIPDVEDACPDEAEVIDLSTLDAADGELDGCPTDSSGTTVIDSDVDIDTDYGTVGSSSASWGCSLGGSAAANPLAFLFMAMVLLPMAIRRKRQ